MAWSISAHRDQASYIAAAKQRCAATSGRLTLLFVALVVAWYWGIDKNFAQIRAFQAHEAELRCNEFAIIQYLANSVFRKADENAEVAEELLARFGFCGNEMKAHHQPKASLASLALDDTSLSTKFLNDPFVAHEQANRLIKKLHAVPGNIDHELLYTRVQHLLQPLSVSLKLSNEELLQYTDEIFKFMVRRETNQNEKSEIEKSIVNFELSGIKLAFPVLYGPPIWSFLFLLLVSIFVVTRRLIYLQLARAILAESRKFKKIVGDRTVAKKLRECFGSAPFWLAPTISVVASDRHFLVAGQSFRKLLGWRTPLLVLSIIFNAALFLALFAIGIDVLNTSGDVLTDPQVTGLLKLSERESDIWLAISRAFFWAASMLYIVDVVLWRQVIVKVSGGGNIGSPTTQALSNLRRRQVLTTFGSVAGVALTIAPFLHLVPVQFGGVTLPAQARRAIPRFRDNRKLQVSAANLKVGPYLNPKSGALHYVIYDQILRYVPSTVRADRLTPTHAEPIVEQFSKEARHARAPTAPFYLELLALKLINEERIAEAAEFLFAILQGLKLTTELDERFIRLIDLTAGLLVRAQGKRPMDGPTLEQALLKLADLSATSISSEKLKSLLTTRKEQWRSERSPWRKKWLDMESPIKWSLPVPGASADTHGRFAAKLQSVTI